MARWTTYPGLAVAFLLSSCTSFDYRYTHTQEQSLTKEILGDIPQVQPVSPLHLTDAAKRVLDAHIDRGSRDVVKLGQLRHFLFDRDGMHLTYSAAKTKTAMQVWNSHTGNCLSLTNLFVAVARYLGLQARFETVDVEPTWDELGATMVRYEHIIAVGRLSDGDQYVVDFLRDFVVGDQGVSQVTDRKALALYYSNLGAESLINGDTRQAKTDLAEALRINDQLSEAWNNMGATLRRTGQAKLAEFAYQRAVHLDTDNYSALTNLAQFYQSQGDTEEAQYFLDRVNAYRQRNPYYHYFIAHRLYESGKYEKAISALHTAVRLKDDDPRFYVALAKSYSKLGRTSESHHYQAVAKRYTKAKHVPAPRTRNREFWTYTFGVK